MELQEQTRTQMTPPMRMDTSSLADQNRRKDGTHFRRGERQLLLR